MAANSVLIEFYFYLGKSISEKENVWGSKLIEQTSKDLRAEFSDMKGLSVRNIKYCRQFYIFYKDIIGQQAVAQLQFPENEHKGNDEQNSQQAVDQFVQQTVAQIPWGHNILIFSKSKDINEALFYISQTLENNWGRETLALQIKSRRRQSRPPNAAQPKANGEYLNILLL